MGLSWAPFLAQAVTVAMCVAGQEGVQEGRTNAFQQGVGVWPHETRAPAAYHRIVIMGKVVALSVVWYDNILVVADSTPRRDSVIARINANARSIGARFKEPNGVAWDVQVAGGEYLGLDFRTEDGVFSWRHGAKTIRRWKENPSRITRHTPALEIAKIAGRCVWDATLRGRSLAQYATPLRLLSVAAAQITETRGWQRTVVALTTQEVAALRKIQTALQHNPEARRPREAAAGPWVRLLSDASSLGVRGMRIEANEARTLLSRPRARAEVEEHINRVELRAAIHTIEAAIAAGDIKQGSRVMLGVDSTTAMAWLSSGWARGLQAELNALLQELAQLRSELFVCYIPTADNASFGPSRLREPGPHGVALKRLDERVALEESTPIKSSRLWA
jgi:hypothetical protein